MVSVRTMLNGRCLLPLRLHVSGVNCTSVAYVCVFVCLCAYVWGGGGWLVEGLRRTSPTLAGGKSIIISFPGERCSEHEPSTSFYPSCPIAHCSIIYVCECVCAYSSCSHSCKCVTSSKSGKYQLKSFITLLFHYYCIFLMTLTVYFH